MSTTPKATSIYGAPSGGAWMTHDAQGNLKSNGVSGSISSSVLHPGNTTYTYDAKSRLTQEQTYRILESGLPYTRNYAYDSAGNPTTFRSTTSIPYNYSNQRTGPESYTYNANGNPTTYKGTSLTYDSQNRMRSYGSTVTYGYDPTNKRTWKTSGTVTTDYLYDGNDLVAEMDISGHFTAINIVGPNGLLARRVGTTDTYYTFDPSGNVAQRINSSGSVASSDVYDAYGAKLAGNPSGDPYGFGGQYGYYTDSETGFVLCTYRYYDPANGRWLTCDPIGYDGGLNLYGYVEGNPVNALDPAGLEPIPLAPPGVSVDENIKHIKTHQKKWGLILTVYYLLHHLVPTATKENPHPWDYKPRDPWYPDPRGQHKNKYADFGNFNYGACAAAAHIPLGIAERGAGWAQVQAHVSNPKWGHFWGLLPPYGDSHPDNNQIYLGYLYYHEHYGKR